MIDDFDALIDAPVTPPRRRPGRPSKADLAAREAERLVSTDFQASVRAAAAGNTLIAEREFHMPVSQNFLARVFNMDPMTVNRRLRKVKPVGHSGEKVKRPIYDFKTACEHLLKPKMDIDTYLATLNPADMPNAINKVFWEAKRIKLKFEIEAGQAWATDDVIEVLGSMAMAIKSHTQLWVERLRDLGLTDEQSLKFAGMVDAYNSDLHEKLVAMPKQRQTRSRLAAIEQEMLAGVEDEADEFDAEG